MWLTSIGNLYSDGIAGLNCATQVDKQLTSIALQPESNGHGLGFTVHDHTNNKVLDDAFLPALADAVQRFATFNGCTEVTLTKCSPTRWRDPMRQALTG